MAGASARPKRRFQLVLIKPSHYDDDGYVIQWMRAFVPSNTLAVLYSLRAIRANAHYVPAYGYAAAIQQNQFKNSDAAGELYARAVAANPDSADARAALAAHLRRLRQSSLVIFHRL